MRTFFCRKNIYTLFLLSSFLIGGQVHAQTTAPSGVACDGTVTAGVCIPGSTGLSSAPIVVILSIFMYWLLSIVGIIAVIAFVISGIQYLTSAGDPKRADTAKSNMVNAIIGVVVALSGLVILQAISTFFTASTTVF